MKNNIVKVFFGVLFFIIILVWYFYLTANKDIKSNSWDNIDLLIRNNSWETLFSDSIPFQKWDEVELNFILKNSNSKVSLDLGKVRQKFDIKEIYIDNEKIDKLDDNLDIKNSKNIKIIAKAKDKGILKEEEKNEIVTDFEENREKLIEEEQEIETQEVDEKLPIKDKEIIIDIKKLNSNINNLIEIKGSSKNLVKYINIWWRSFTPVSKSWSVFISVDKNTFVSWSYFVIIQFNDSEVVTLDKKIYFDFSSDKVNIANITPNVIENDIDRYVVLQWNGLSKVISIQLNNNIILKNTSFDIINDNVLSVKIPKWLSRWYYYFNIMTTEWIYVIKNLNFYIDNK